MRIKQIAISAILVTNIAYSFDLSSIDITSIDQIDTTLGTVNQTLTDYWDKYDIDTLLKDSSLNNELISCLTDGKTLQDFLGTPQLDGICGSLGGSGLNGVGDFFDNPLVKCAGVAKPSTILDAEKYLNDFCNKSGSSTTTKWVFDGASGTWTTSLV